MIRTLLRRLVVALVVVAMPLAQAKATFICPMMQSVVLERCCCEHEGDVRESPRDESAPCCTVGLQLSETRVVAPSAIGAPVVAKQLNDGGSLAAIVETFRDFSVAANDAIVLPRRHVAPFLSHSDLYLLTARLRL
jgi:hypothetical protein